MFNNLIENFIKELKNNKDINTYIMKHIDLMTTDIIEKSSITIIGIIFVIISLIQLFVNIYILYSIKNIAIIS